MKLIKFKTEITNDELFLKFQEIPISELEFILNFSKYFNHIDINCKENKTGLFGIMADCYVEKLENFFQKYSIPYTIRDMSKDAFFDNTIEISYKDSSGNDITDKLKTFVFNFKKDYITQDDVLDKILEKGINSLTDFDKDVLK
jgi:hypothetical protein